MTRNRTISAIIVFLLIHWLVVLYIIIFLNQVAKIQDTRSAIFFEKICFNFYLFSHANNHCPLEYARNEGGIHFLA